MYMAKPRALLVFQKIGFACRNGLIDKAVRMCNYDRGLPVEVDPL